MLPGMETLLDVKGMTCMNCVRHVERALAQVEGVAQVKVDLSHGTAAVEHAAGTSLASLVAAVEEEGYVASAR